MLIFNQDTEEGFLNINKYTKKVFIGFFISCPYNQQSDLDNFFNEDLGIHAHQNDFTQLNKNKTESIITYDIAGGGTSDRCYVLTIPFNNEQEARTYINSKIKTSKYVHQISFDEFAFIDADLFLQLLKEKSNINQKETEALTLLEKEFNIFYKTMKEKYHDNSELMSLIESIYGQ
jgi:hypothetical protein